MAGSVNKVILVGNLGADPEIRRLNSGKSVANLRIATSESWKDQRSGERQEKTEWHTVVVFSEPTVNFIEQYVQKGDKVYVEGQLQTRSWEDQSGQKKYSTEVVVQAFGGKVETLSQAGGGNGGGRGRSDDDEGGSRRGGSRGGSRGGDDDRGSRGGGRGSRDRDDDHDDDRGSRGGSRGGGRGSSRDLDDDIPF